MDYYFKPYVPVAKRKSAAKREVEAARKAGRAMSPVVIDRLKIAATFWGKAWCDNLESYSDYANRMPRGRTYVRSGAVIDLQIAAGVVKAKVMGSSLYTVTVKIESVTKSAWAAICADSAGEIDSMIELLMGRLHDGVMKRMCAKGEGLFPGPKEIQLECSCPDWAGMCKHVAATLYGVGARLDSEPAMLFKLRGVEPTDLLKNAAGGASLAGREKPDKAMAADDLASLFGLEMAEGFDAATPLVQAKKKTKDAMPAARKATKRATKKVTTQAAVKRLPSRFEPRAATMARQGQYMAALSVMDAASRKRVQSVAIKMGVAAALDFARSLVEKKKKRK